MNKSKINTRQMILCALFAALISVGTFLKIPGPVVPITMQFLFVNLAALVLGSRYGTISVAVY
ncbi:MAG: biotin transporter BioY, partial [Clostridia bacterium]